MILSLTGFGALLVSWLIDLEVYRDGVSCRERRQYHKQMLSLAVTSSVLLSGLDEDWTIRLR